MFDFSNRVVLITGAAGNLGRAAAQAFLACGGIVVAVDHSRDRLESSYGDALLTGGRLILQAADANVPDSVARAVAHTVEGQGGIDVLVNTVGGYRAGTPVHETPLETWDFMMTLNARTAFIASRAVAPHMLKAGRGKIIHVASRAALSGGAGAAAYSASKSALMRLTESLAAELKPAVNVNCVMPSTIDTPQNRQAMPDADHSRWTKTEAIADVILFLASDAARAVHGAAIPV